MHTAVTSTCTTTRKRILGRNSATRHSDHAQRLWLACGKCAHSRRSALIEVYVTWRLPPRIIGHLWCGQAAEPVRGAATRMTSFTQALHAEWRGIPCLTPPMRDHDRAAIRPSLLHVHMSRMSWQQSRIRCC